MMSDENRAEPQTGKGTAAPVSDEQDSKAADLPRYVPRRVIRVNGRLLLVLLLVFSGIAGGTYALHGWQMERNAESLLKLVAEAEQKGETGDAIRYLSQYLRIRPKDFDAKVRLADLFEGTSQSYRTRTTMLGILEEVLRSDPNRSDVNELRRRAVDLAVGIGRFRDALTHLEILQKQKNDGRHDPELVFIGGQCHEGLSDFRNAVWTYLRVMQQSPEMIGPYIRLAAVLTSHPDAAPLRDDLEASTDPDFDEDIESLFRAKTRTESQVEPTLPQQNNDETGPEVTDDSASTAQQDAQTAADDDNRVLSDEDLVTAIYDLLIDRGKPEFRAHLARAEYYMTRQEYDDAEADVNAALDLAGENPDADVLNTAVTLALAQAELAALSYDAPQQREERLRIAEQLAKQGSHLPPPESIRFYIQLAHVEQQRANEAAGPDQRDAHFGQAESYRETGKTQLDNYRESEEGKKGADAQKLLGYEIALLGLRAELIIARAGREGAESVSFFSDPNSKESKAYESAMIRLRELGAAPGQIRLFEARALLVQQKWRRAADRLALVRRRVETDRNLRRQVENALAVCYQQLHLPEVGIQILKHGLGGDFGWHEGRLLLANMLAAQGRNDEALESYRILLQGERSIPAALLPLARLQIRRAAAVPAERRDVSPVFSILDNADELNASGKTSLDEVALLLLRVDALYIDTADAQRMSKIEKLLDAASTKHERLLDEAIAESDQDDAAQPGSQDKSEAVKTQMDNLARLYAARANFEAQRPDHDETTRVQSALRRLDDADAKLPDNSVLMVARAQIALRLERDPASKILEKLTSDASELPESERAATLEVIARGYATLGDRESSRAVWKTVTSLVPESMGVRLATAMLAVVLSDRKWLDEQLKVIRRIENGDDDEEKASATNGTPERFVSTASETRNGPWGNYFEALYLIVSADKKRNTGRQQLADLPAEERTTRAKPIVAGIQRDLQQARRLLDYCVRLRPDWPEPLHQLGRVADLLGDREEAFRSFRGAIGLGDRTSRAFEYCVGYHLARGEIDEADVLINLAGGPGARLLSPEKLNLSDNRISLPELAVQVALARGEIAKARSYFAEESADYRQKIVLALLKYNEYETLSDRQKQSPRGKALLDAAEGLLRQAIEVASDAPEPWIYLVHLLTRLDRQADAEAVIVEAQQKLPEDAADLTAARCYIILGKVEQADQHFQRAVAARPDDVGLRLFAARFYAANGLFPKTQSHLDAVLDSKTNATDAQRAVARHMKLLLIASGGRYADLNKALALLADAQKSSLADLYTRAKILQKSSLQRDRRALIDVLLEIDRRKRLTPGDRFQLARLYEKSGQWSEARKIVQEMLKEYPQDQLLLGWFAAELLDNEGDSPPALVEARRLVDRLKTLRPEELSTATVEAHLLIAEAAPDHRQKAAEVIETAAERVINGRTKLEKNDLRQVVMAARVCESFDLDEAAERLLRRYASLSEEPDALLAVATFLGRQNRSAEALKICEQLRQTAKPRNVAVAAVNIVSPGNVSPADLAAAERLLTDALAADPKSKDLKFSYAEFLTAAGRLDEAESLYRQLLAELPDNVAVMNNLAWLSALDGRNLEDALDLVNGALDVSGPQAQILDTRAMLLIQMAQFDKAAADLEQAIGESPAASFYLHLARVRLAAGDRPEAADAMQRAVAAGLSIDRLHRLELPGFRQVVEATGVGP